MTLPYDSLHITDEYFVWLIDFHAPLFSHKIPVGSLANRTRDALRIAEQL